MNDVNDAYKKKQQYYDWKNLPLGWLAILNRDFHPALRFCEKNLPLLPHCQTPSHATGNSTDQRSFCQ